MLKNIIVYLNKSVKLNDDNLRFWSYKIWYILGEQNIFEGINHILSQPEKGYTVQYRKDVKAYKFQKMTDFIAHGIMVAFMVDELIYEYEEFFNTNATWIKKKVIGIRMKKRK